MNESNKEKVYEGGVLPSLAVDSKERNFVKVAPSLESSKETINRVEAMRAVRGPYHRWGARRIL